MKMHVTRTATNTFKVPAELAETVRDILEDGDHGEIPCIFDAWLSDLDYEEEISFTSGDKSWTVSN